MRLDVLNLYLCKMSLITIIAALLMMLPETWTYRPGDASRDYADSCYAAGDYRHAVNGYRMALRIRDSTTTVLLREQKAMDMLIIEHRETIARQKFGYICVAVIIAMLIVIIGYIFYNLEKLRQKNKILYEQISQNVNYDIESDAPPKPLSKLGSLVEKIKKEHLFTDPSFGREALVSMLGTNESYLYNMFKEEYGTTVSAYITHLRLEYSITIIKSEKKIPIEELAIRCGFNNARTLQRLFKSNFGLTPSEYLKFEGESL